MGQKKKHTAAIWVSDRLSPSLTHCKTSTILSCMNVVPKLFPFKNAKKIVSSESGEGKEKVQIIVLKQKNI